ncbi:YihY/virulence factor BrkB family protein [Altibacter sp. HG106]|uniref:YihY/virulence factor BrkB family protein n=1 Tax=Altibacter sp. HG106 TaxID=3023937 RepID=UPI002350750F|nr:YihY/virulence factor BrkB family protein [Altibacter sp. HG106]MDC7993734.1 YihY/virulence factor BrkB family protein [Altibacter sp. HG106]
MTEVEENLLKIPVLRQGILWSQRVVLPGLNGLTLYDLLATYVSGIIKGTFSSRASSIAYSFFMALFPFLLFILNLIPYVPIKNFQERFLVFIEIFLPPQTQEFFYPVIEDIALNPRSGLLSFSIILAMFLAANGVNTIFSAFEYSVYVTINRSFFRQYFIALAVSVFLALLLLLTVVMVLLGEYFIESIKGQEFINNEAFLVSALQLVISFVLIYSIIASLYYFGTKKQKDMKFVSIGASLTTILFMLTTYLFGVYITNFSNYNELYGSIGALLIMMFYIWINANLLLLGFELNASIRQLKKNNTNNENRNP